jgi:hypothetical protein
MIISDTEYLAHYGVLRRSGRYPWGSGRTENARNKAFLDYIEEMKAKGLSEVQIAKGVDMSTTDLRALKSIAKNQQKAADVAMAVRLKERGWSNVAISERMYGTKSKESTVRALLADNASAKADDLTNTADMLRRQVEEKTFVDIGAGVEAHVGVSKDKLNTAVAILKEEGYRVHPVKIRQLGTGLDTELKVLCPPGTTQRDLFLRKLEVRQIGEYADRNRDGFDPILPPRPIDPKRVKIRYDEDGGAKEDGVIYVRPGVKDLSMGGNAYAQVRIQVGPNHYLKGMAIHRDDLPPGVDLVFNTNKAKKDQGDKSELDFAAKKLTDDPDLPFGSIIRQVKDPKTGELSGLNMVNEQGDWGGWSRTLSSQVLSKQSPTLAKQQLDLAHDQRKAELADIMALTNPTVKRKLLESFADETDAAAVHLKAAALPRQNWHVIIPIPSLKANEVYAPNYVDGEQVALIRYPHGGKFEIPIVTVNNRNRDARKTIGTNSTDAIGINHKVANHLSGADFDGDTVLVIPNRSGRIQNDAPLKSLKDFEPRKAYPKYDGMPVLTPTRKQQLMGDVSNLITDMTILGASHEELARAVRHSMVVIDAEKHELNHRQSALDNGIASLKQQYQGRTNAGAATLVSRKKSNEYVPERRLRRASEGGPVDPVTGRKVYVETGRMTKTKTGEQVPKKEKVKKLDLTDDANTLLSEARTPMERNYAEYSNNMRKLAGQARLAALDTPRLQWSPSAKRTYAAEVRELDAHLALANRNRPLERQAQILANAEIKAKRAATPDMPKEVRKKMEYQALAQARIRTGAGKEKVTLTDRQWQAIQQGAISDSKLASLLLIANDKRIKELATPRERLVMTPAKTTQATRLLKAGLTRAEVADRLGVSLSTLNDLKVEGIEHTAMFDTAFVNEDGGM